MNPQQDETPQHLKELITLIQVMTAATERQFQHMESIYQAQQKLNDSIQSFEIIASRIKRMLPKEDES
jgi:hypothetical protein